MLIEKDQLLPFEEAKLYGHNAIHALMAYLGAYKGYTMMSQLRDDSEIMRIAGEAFIYESGAALIKKYSHLNDELFTEAGFTGYAEDLLERITNPYLEDTIGRAGRDPVRKLGLNDRLFGAMALCLEQGIKPTNIALGAAAGIIFLQQKESDLLNSLGIDSRQQLTFQNIQKILIHLWKNDNMKLTGDLIRYSQEAYTQLIDNQNR